MTHNSSVNFKLKYFQLWTKESYESSNFEKFPKLPMLFSKRQDSFSSNFASLSSVMKELLCTFLDQTLHTFHGRNKSKCKFLRLLSARIKIHQILVIFKTTNQFSFNFFYQSWVPSNITSLYFLSWSIIYFGQKQPIKVQIFEIFECLGQNLLNSSCQFWTSQFLFKFSIFLHCYNT